MYARSLKDHIHGITFLYEHFVFFQYAGFSIFRNCWDMQIVWVDAKSECFNDDVTLMMFALILEQRRIYFRRKIWGFTLIGPTTTYVSLTIYMLEDDMNWQTMICISYVSCIVLQEYFFTAVNSIVLFLW